MQTQADITLVIAGAVQQHMDKDWQIGMDDNHVFLMTQGQVFRIRVEEIMQITKSDDPENAARGFMLTLPYGPAQ